MARMARINKVYDSNGNVVRRDIRRERGGWGVNVWSGDKYVTTVKRNIYATRAKAADADISDDIGRDGRIA